MPLKSKGKKEKLRVGCLLILLFSSNHYCFSSIPTAELLATEGMRKAQDHSTASACLNAAFLKASHHRQDLAGVSCSTKGGTHPWDVYWDGFKSQACERCMEKALLGPGSQSRQHTQPDTLTPIRSDFWVNWRLAVINKTTMKSDQAEPSEKRTFTSDSLSRQQAKPLHCHQAHLGL